MATRKTHYPIRLKGGTEVAYCGRLPSNLDVGLRLAPYDASFDHTTCKECLSLMSGPQKHRQRQVAFLQDRDTSASLRKNLCQNCNEPIKVQIFKGTSYCSVDCEKEATG